MFDADEYRRRFLDNPDEELKKAYSKKSREFMFLKPKNLANGQYLLRFLPPMPEKCPEGYTRVATHRVPVTIGGDPKTVECIRTADEPCAVCDLMRAVAGERRDMDASVKDAFQGMDPWVRAVYPISIYAWPQNPDDRASMWVPSKEEHGAIFEVSAESLIRNIFNLFLASNNKLNHAQKGFYVTLTKNHHQYELALKKQIPLQNDRLIQASVYPSIEKMMFQSERYPVLRLTYKQQLQFLEDCWFVEDEKVAPFLTKLAADSLRVSQKETASFEDEDDDTLPFDDGADDDSDSDDIMSLLK
mgnify:CR=1 FL=1